MSRVRISTRSIIFALPVAAAAGWLLRPGIAVTSGPAASAAAPVSAVADVPADNARRELRMLDDLYKSSIVLITTHYVDDAGSLPAGSAFKALFQTMKEKGWHEVRLLDGTGEPYNPDNAPNDGFEKSAVAKIAGGEASVDEVVTENGKRYLLGATAIPVVMDKCTLCHENYKTVPAGRAIGALGYKIPIHD